MATQNNIDFNEACEINTSKIKYIPESETARLELVINTLIQHCMHGGQYAPGPTSDVCSFGYMAIY